MSSKLFVSLLVLVAIVVLPTTLVIALNTPDTGFQVATTTVKIDAHTICRNANSTDGLSYFVPTKTLIEWQSVISHHPVGLNLASCSSCVPKPNQITSGFTSCAITSTGELYCWSSFSEASTTPVMAGTFSEIVDNGMGDVICGLRTDGTLQCWNSAGVGTPIVAPAGNYKSIVGNASNYCAIRSDNTVRCWGDYSGFMGGYFGDAVSPTGTFKSVVNTASYSCGLHLDNSVTCWGGRYVPTSAEVASINGISNAQSIHLVNRGMAYGGINYGGTPNICVLDSSGVATCTQLVLTTGLAGKSWSQLAATCGITTDGYRACYNDTTKMWEMDGVKVKTIDANIFYSSTCDLTYDGTIGCIAANASAQNRNLLRCE